MLFVGIFLVSAIDSSYIYEQNTSIDLKVPCINNDNSLCVDSTNCTITILHPNNTILIDGANMTYNTNYFNYTVDGSETNDLGDYVTSVSCIGTTNGFTSFYFKVTPNGEELTTGTSLFYLGTFLVLGLLLGILIKNFVDNNNIKVKFALLQFSYLTSIGISFIAWDLTKNFLWNAPFITSFFRILWWVLISGFFPFLILSCIWLIYMLISIKEIQSMVERGIPETEALNRRGGLFFKNGK